MNPTVYCIENIFNNKKYIGSTKDISKRWRSHKNLLSKNKHPNVHLQTAWNLYTKDKFKFYIIEENIEESLLLNREQYYIELYDVLDREKGYNIAKNASAPMDGRKHTEISIVKMKEAKSGEKNNFFGKHHTEETKQKLREAKIGKKLSPQHREKVIKSGYKTGENNINSKLTIEKVRQIRKEYNEAENKKTICKILSNKYGICFSTVRRIIKNELWKEDTNDNSEQSRTD